MVDINATPLVDVLLVLLVDPVITIPISCIRWRRDARQPAAMRAAPRGGQASMSPQR